MPVRLTTIRAMKCSKEMKNGEPILAGLTHHT